MKNNFGQTGGPFQLLISVIVFGMALAIGGYLFQNMECHKCSELLNNQARELSEAISTIGKGAVNSRKSIMVKVEDLGSCVKGFYLNKIGDAPGTDCASFCPKHPNSCWAIITETSCGGDNTEYNCIDVSGDLNIVADPDFLSTISSPNKWIDQSYGFTNSLPITLKKTGTNELTLGKL